MSEKLKPIIVIAEEMLDNKPPRKFLTGEVRVAADLLSLKAIALFPSSEPSLGERGHVNTTHYIDGVWNAAHILAEMNGLESPLSVRGQWENPNFAYELDKPMTLRFEIIEPVVEGRKVRGGFKATYTDLNDNRVYSEITGPNDYKKPGFVAIKKKESNFKG